MIEKANYSEIFGYRKYRAYYILEDFCNKYYNHDMHDYLYNKSENLKSYLTHNIQKCINNCDPHIKIDIPGTIENFNASFIGGIHVPNGEYQWPDHIIDILSYKNIHIDTKSVLVDNSGDKVIFSYNNACGQIKEVSDHILNHWNNNDDAFYKSFIIFVYYTKLGEILDTLIMPMIYCINLRKFDWDNLNSFNFLCKSNGNFNICIGLPSFMKKTGMLNLEEQELALATATYNYINKSQKHGKEICNIDTL